MPATFVQETYLPIDNPDLRPHSSDIASHPPVQKAVVTVFDSRSMHSRARPRQSIPLRKAVSARCTHPAGVFILPTRNPWSQRALQAHCLPQIGIHPMQSIRCHHSKRGSSPPHPSVFKHGLRLLRSRFAFMAVADKKLKPCPGLPKPKENCRFLQFSFCIPL